MKQDAPVRNMKCRYESPSGAPGLLIRPEVIPNLLLAIFLLISTVHLCRSMSSPGSRSEVSAGAFWISAALATLSGLTRRLPGQNAVAICVIAGAIGAGLTFTPPISRFLRDSTGMPAANDNYGIARLFPFFWIACVLSCRGVARFAVLALKPRRKAGLWTLLLASSLIAVLADASVGSLSKRTVERPENAFLLLTWFLTAAVTLVLLLPWLIDKRSQAEPHDLNSAVVCLVLNIDLLIQLCAREAWPAAGLLLLLNMIVATAAFSGYRKVVAQTGSQGAS